MRPWPKDPTRMTSVWTSVVVDYTSDTTELGTSRKVLVTGLSFMFNMFLRLPPAWVNLILNLCIFGLR